jgi:hypothetical protein
VVDMWCTAMARATRVRRENPEIDARIVDIAQRDLVHDPVEAVKQIYQRFDVPFTADLERRMTEFLAHHPAGSRLGRHKHSPEEFGIDPAEVHERLAEYYQRFGHLLAKP